MFSSMQKMRSWVTALLHHLTAFLLCDFCTSFVYNSSCRGSQMSSPFRKGPRQRGVNSRAVTSCESTAQLPPDLQDLCERHHVLHARFFFALPL